MKPHLFFNFCIFILLASVLSAVSLAQVNDDAFSNLGGGVNDDAFSDLEPDIYCSDPNVAFANPDVCGQLVGNPPSVSIHGVPGVVIEGNPIYVTVVASDDVAVNQVKLTYELQGGGVPINIDSLCPNRASGQCEWTFTCNPGNKQSCKDIQYAFPRTSAPTSVGAKFVFTATATDSDGLSSLVSVSGVTEAEPSEEEPLPTVITPVPPLVEPEPTPEEPEIPVCTAAAWSCTGFAPAVCPQSGQQARTCTLINTGCSSPNAVKPSESQSCAFVPPLVTNNPPVITDFAVPSTADAGSQITVSVAATDSDGGVDRIEILQNDGSTIITSQSCSGIVSCTRSFILQVPDAFSSVYTFIARAFDNLGASATATASGATNPPEPAHVPAPTPRPEEALAGVRVKVPSENIFVSTLVPDTGCVAPGAETFLYSSLRNRGSKSLKDVRITATVSELGIRVVSGPFRIKKGDSASRLLNFDIPFDAEPGVYYMRVSITSERDSVVKYRMFEVNRAC